MKPVMQEVLGEGQDDSLLVKRYSAHVSMAPVIS